MGSIWTTKLHFVEERLGNSRPREKVKTELRREVGFHWSKFDGTPGEVPSSHGNTKINSRRIIHTSSLSPHRTSVLHCVRLEDQGLSFKGESITPEFSSLGTSITRLFIF
ncbi:hypothetical protein Tco_0979307 [Tanacetum coccineum]